MISQMAQHNFFARNALLTTNSPSLLASLQPPSQTRFILLTATSRFPVQSGRAPAPHCIADKTVVGASSDFQSHSHTVPKEPSPTSLMAEYSRG